GTFDEYARLYDYTEAALHGVLPNASLGGPASATPGTAVLGQFLEHCETGTNAVTGQAGTRLDMVSFHAKGGVRITDEHVQMSMGTQLRLHRSGFDQVAQSAFAATPIVITEADPDGCAACPVSMVPADAYRNSPAYGAYEVAMMKRSLDLAAANGVNLRGVLTWAFTFPDTPYFAGYRALATNGIHLPVLNAFKLLGGLSGERLAVVSSGARPLDDVLMNSVRAEPDIDALAAVDGDRISVLVWNYHDDLVPAEPASVTLRVALPPAFGAHAALTHTRVDDTHGNAYGVWLSQGSPAAPSDAQQLELREAMEPVVLERDRVVPTTGGGVNVSFELPRFGISLLTLVPSSGPPPEPPAKKADAGCSCRLSPPSSAGYRGPLFALSLLFALRVRLRGLRRDAGARPGRRGRRTPRGSRRTRSQST
ncbi:MAG TPA: hypothetical protein VF103_17620, partial [Polyangiaceae bacterium]